MAIRSGIGIGAAQIADTSNIMNAYGRQIAQQQKAQALQAEKEAKSAEKYNEELADIMASVKTEGARDIDVPDITDAYNQIKEYYSQSAKLKDSDKPLFRAELKNKINGLNEFAQRSNKFSKDLFAMSSDIAKNEWDYDPASVSELNKMSQTTLKQLGANAVIDPMRFKRLPNFGLIDTIIDKTYKLGEENAKFAGERFDKGKRFNVKRIDPAVIQNNLIQQFTSSPEAIKAISSLYVRELGKQPTDQDLTNYIMDKYKTKHGFDYVGEAKDLERPRGGGGGGAEADKLSYRQQLIGGVMQLDPSSLSKMQAQLPSGSKIDPLSSKKIEGYSKGGYPTYKVRVTIPATDTRSQISEIIDLKTGEPGIRLNQLLNEYSGETVSYSKFGIEGAKPRGQQFEPPKPRVTTPAKPTQAKQETWTEKQIRLRKEAAKNKK